MSDAEFTGALEAAVESKDGEALARLSRSELSKVQRKELKRAAHRLRSMGIGVALEEAAPGKKEPAAEVASVDVLATSIDGSGARMMWLFADGASGGREAVACYISDTDGYKLIQLAASGRKRAGEVKRDLLRSKDVPIVELDGAHARAILDEADVRTRESGHSFPKGYGALHEMVKKLPPAMPLDPHPAQALVGELSERQAVELLRDSASILTERPFLGWGPDRNTGRELTQKIENVLTSTVIVGNAQRIDQIEHLFAQAAAAALEGPGRAMWVRRLRDAAHVLHGRGEQALGVRVARIAEAIDRNAAGEVPALLPALLRRPFEQLFERLREGGESGEAAGAADAPAPASKLIVPGR